MMDPSLADDARGAPRDLGDGIHAAILCDELLAATVAGDAAAWDTALDELLELGGAPAVYAVLYSRCEQLLAAARCLGTDPWAARHATEATDGVDRAAVHLRDALDAGVPVGGLYRPVDTVDTRTDAAALCRLAAHFMQSMDTGDR
jgi:hypothetical protein